MHKEKGNKCFEGVDLLATYDFPCRNRTFMRPKTEMRIYSQEVGVEKKYRVIKYIKKRGISALKVIC